MSERQLYSRKDFLRTVTLSSLTLLPGCSVLEDILCRPPKDKNDHTLKASEVINEAYRLLQYKSLLNLELYFVNVEKRNGKLYSIVCPDHEHTEARKKEGKGCLCGDAELSYFIKSYMIVRLPQQHVAEQFIPSVELADGTIPDNYKFIHTAISGYSFLCFQIDFSMLKDGLKIDGEHFLDWNAPHFDLITRDKSDRPLFELHTTPDNNYPLGYRKENDTLVFDPANFPNITMPEGVNNVTYPNTSSGGKRPLVVNPVTAIEAPYRLLISPFRPSAEYKFTWIFSFYASDDTLNVGDYELWTATLQMQKTSFLKQDVNEKKQEETSWEGKEITTPVQLMVLGTPDVIFAKEKKADGSVVKKYDTSITKKVLTDTVYLPDDTIGKGVLIKSLPDPIDRINLNELGKRQYLANAPELMFTPLGISANINLINPNPEGNHIPLVKWHHWISFGRDQEVEVAELVMEATFGLKMLYIRTTRRETVAGNAAMIYREFLMPYESNKDYHSYNNDEVSVYKDPNFKFNTPTSKISFRFKGAKQILPLYMMNDHILYPDGDGPKRPLAYWPVTPGRKFVDWEFDIVCQGQEQPVTVVKRIFIVTNNLASSDYPMMPEELKTLTDGALKQCNDILGNAKVNATQKIAEINAIWGKITPSTEKNPWAKVLRISEDFELSKLDLYREQIDKIIPEIETWIKEQALTDKKDFLNEAMEAWGAFKRSAFNAEKGFTELLVGLQKNIQAEITDKITWIEGHANNIETQINDKIAAVKKDIENVEKAINNAAGSAREILEKKRADLDKEIKDLEKLAKKPDAIVIAAIADFKTNIKQDLDKLTDQISLTLKQIDDDLKNGATNVISKFANKRYTLEIETLAKNLETALYKHRTYGQKAFTNYESIRLSISEQIQKIKSTSMAGFEVYKKQFLEKLPVRFVNEVLSKKNEALNTLKNVLAEINHIEGNLRSRIDCAKAEIGYAVNEISDEIEQNLASAKKHLEDKYNGYTDEAKKEYEKIKKAYTDEVNGSINNMKTDFMVFRNNFRQSIIETEHKALDFYHDHACFPQLHTAQVYVSAVKDLINTDLPLKIKYAEDYIKNQVDSTMLETQKNAARVFVELKSEAQEQFKGAMRSVAHDLGGIVSPQLGDKYLTFLKDKKNELNELKARAGKEFTEGIKNEVRFTNETLNKLNDELKAKKSEVLAQYNQLVSLTEEVKRKAVEGVEEVKAKGEEFFKSMEAKIVGSIQLKDLLKGIDFKIPNLNRKGDKLVYQFITPDGKIQDVTTPGNQFKFIASADAVKTQLSIYLEKDIKNVSNFKSITQLRNFTIGVFSERLLIKVDKLELLNTQSVKNKCTFALKKIEFQKELEFFAKLAQGVKIPGTGLTLHVTPKEIGVDFSFGIPSIATGAFTLDNMKFIFGVVIPLPVGPFASHQPMITKVAVNSPEDKFTVGVLIFGGKGHFMLETTPRYIRLIDVGIDFGGNLQLSLFIASGQAYLMAGIRFVYQRNDEGETTMKFYAILTCGACLTVFGFINISVVFSLYLTYIDSGSHAALYGTCTISCSVSVGFFSRSFNLTMEKKISGTGESSGSAYVSPRKSGYMIQNEEGVWSDQEEEHDETGGKYDIEHPDLIKHMTPQAWFELLDAYNF